jgi:hypothetical protein
MSKLRRNAEGKDCSLRLHGCNYDPATTVLAHLRINGWAGMGQKPDDLLAVFACSHCHDVIDRRASGDWTHGDLLRAMGETLLIQKQDGMI